MSETWWNLSGTDKHCDSYGPGHWVHPLSDGQADELMIYAEVGPGFYFHTHTICGALSMHGR